MMCASYGLSREYDRVHAAASQSCQVAERCSDVWWLERRTVHIPDA